MPHPLDGTRLKIIRAQEHLDALKNELRAYMCGDPYEIPVEIKDNQITVDSVQVTNEPPIHLCAVLGDCISNLRASLDYIAWQLVLRYNSIPLTNWQERRVAFPISPSDNAAFIRSKSLKQLVACNVPATAIDAIERAQPYHAGHDPLKWLSILANEDKHRLPLLTIACIEQSYSRDVFKIVLGYYTQLAAHHGPGVIRLTDSSFQAPGPGSAIDPAGKVQVNCQPTIFVAMQNVLMPREPVELTLSKIIKLVTDIVPCFETFF